MMIRFPRYQNQGQQISLGWDTQSSLKDWTAYLGTDGVPFLPPRDRNGFSDGIERPLATGRVLMSGLNISRQTFPWVSFGQIDFLETTFSGQNVTVAIHKPRSLTKTSTYTYNAVCNIDMNQIQSLTPESNGYKLFVVSFVLVEPL